MSKPDTAGLKTFLKGMVRRIVPHPEVEGEKVRVEGVSRETWRYRRNGELRSCRFADMGAEQIERILGEEGGME